MAQRGTFPPKNGNGNGGQQPEIPELRLPPKLGRGNLVQNLSELPILVNGYMMKFGENCPEKIFKHELKFMSTNKKGIEKDLSRGPRNDISNILRHEALFDMFQVLVRNHSGNFGNCEGDRIYQYVYDCGINFYSRGKLLNIKEELKLEIDMSKLRQSTVDFLSRNLEKITAVILATDEIDLKSTSAVSEELEKRDRSVVQFLEILSNQLIYNNRTYFIYAQKMFAKANNAIQVEGDPRIIKSGMSKNVRFVGDNPSNSLPLVQVDPKKTLFFPGMALLEYIRLLTRTNLPDLDRRITDERFKRQLLKEIKGLAVRTSHLQKNSYFNIHGLTAEGPANIFFETKDGRKSVLQHFQDRYHFRVQFPNLPCVVERKVKKVDGQNRTVDSHYPMEVLVLEEGQRVPLSKMTPKLTEQMIRNCQARPSQFPRDLEQQRANAMIQSGAPNFRAFDIRIDTEIRKANAEIMFPPAIGYSNGVQQLPVQDRDGKDDVAWMVKGKRFLVPADDPKIWVAVLFQQGIPANDVKAFLQGLVRCAGDMGMNLNKENHQEGINSTDIETVRTRMMFFKNNGAKFVLFFTKDKLDPVHHTMKLLEVETGVVTQQVSKQTVDKVASGRGALLVYNNILQKLNMKLGGINWDLSTTQAFLTRNKTQQDVVKTMWLKQARMFIGIDMSHAGPQSFVERNQGVPPSDPTIVGMAFTAGHPLLIRGTYWCQTPRLTIVERLADKVTEALNIYKNIPQNKGNFPRQLVVFRGGVSEGEYAKVITQEERFFKMAFDNIKKEVPDFIEPILVIIVVQRTSNYRIVPQNVDPNANPARQNVPAGTVVDRGVMHPTQTEFLLVAHKAIQGTAHPIKCTIVYDNGEKHGQQRMSLEEAEYITYLNCYGHAIVSSPVSVPAPLYSAADLAKRGRNNWKTHAFGGDSESTISGEGGRARNTGDPSFWVDLSETLKPRINTKFWA